MQTDPAALVKRAQAGSRSAFSLLVELFLARALAVAVAVVRSQQLAEDIVQIALLRAWQALGQLNQPDRFGAWLCSIVRNTAKNWLRDHAHDERPADPDAPEPADSPPPSDDWDDPELGAAVDALPEDQREVLLLRYMNGLSYGEISEVLDVDASIVRDRLFRAKSALKKGLR